MVAGRGIPISGASDSDMPLLALTISDASLCDSCIARKIGLAERDVAAAVAELGKTMKLTTELGRCDGCLRADLVSRLG